MGKIFNQMVHAKMIMDCSDLQFHLYLRYLTEDPACRCGATIEDPNHLFRTCPLYNIIREQIFGHNVRSSEVILYGYKNNDTQTNITLSEKVHEFIERSDRF